MIELPIAILGAIALGVAAFFVGRSTGAGAKQVRELSQALNEATQDGARSREELESYRSQVSDHFAETSEKLHDLTVQYRAVYDHLARGAGSLCPESFEKLEGGLGLDALPEGPSGDADAPSQAATPASPESGAEAPRPDEDASAQAGEAPRPDEDAPAQAGEESAPERQEAAAR